MEHIRSVLVFHRKPKLNPITLPWETGKLDCNIRPVFFIFFQKIRVTFLPIFIHPHRQFHCMPFIHRMFFKIGEILIRPYILCYFPYIFRLCSHLFFRFRTSFSTGRKNHCRQAETNRKETSNQPFIPHGFVPPVFYIQTASFPYTF